MTNLFLGLHDDKLPFVGHLPLESTERLLSHTQETKEREDG